MSERTYTCPCGKVIGMRTVVRTIEPLSKVHRKMMGTIQSRKEKRCEHEYAQRASGWMVCAKCDKVVR